MSEAWEALLAGARRRHVVPRGSSLALLVPSVWMLLFGLGPLLVIGAYSLFGTQFNEMGRSPSLANLRAVITNPVYRRLFIDSWLLALTVAAICAVVGIASGYFLAFHARHPQIWLAVILLPFFAGVLPRVLSLRTTFGANGPIASALGAIGAPRSAVQSLLFTKTGTVLGLVYALAPLVAVVCFMTFSGTSVAVLEAAKDLGAGEWQVIRTVLLPASVTGISSVVLLVLALSFGAYAEPALLGGAEGAMLGNLIADRYLILFDWGSGAALAVVGIVTGAILTMMLVALMLVARVLLRRHRV